MKSYLLWVPKIQGQRAEQAGSCIVTLKKEDSGERLKEFSWKVWYAKIPVGDSAWFKLFGEMKGFSIWLLVLNSMYYSIVDYGGLLQFLLQSEDSEKKIYKLSLKIQVFSHFQWWAVFSNSTKRKILESYAKAKKNLIQIHGKIPYFKMVECGALHFNYQRGTLYLKTLLEKKMKNLIANHIQDPIWSKRKSFLHTFDPSLEGRFLFRSVDRYFKLLVIRILWGVAALLFNSETMRGDRKKDKTKNGSFLQWLKVVWLLNLRGSYDSTNIIWKALLCPKTGFVV